MRSKLTLRTKRAIHVAIATIMLAVPASAFALSAPSLIPRPPTRARLHVPVSPRRTTLSHAVTVSGHGAGWRTAGHRAVLETAAQPPRATGVRWQATHDATRRAVSPSAPVCATPATCASSTPARLPSRPRVQASPARRPAPAWPARRSALSSPPVSASPSTRWTCSPVDLSVSRRAAPGPCRPRRSRPGPLRVMAGGRSASGRTGPDRPLPAPVRVPPAALQRRLRVRFAGDRGNAGASALAGRDDRVQARASRPGTTTPATRPAASTPAYGVANRTPAVRHQGPHPLRRPQRDRHRRDRGPFVGGRDWDLNQNTASRAGLRRRRHDLGLASSTPAPASPPWCRGGRLDVRSRRRRCLA